MPPALHRTPLTWAMYCSNGVSAFFVYSVGPATPLIADDLGISRQAASLHGAAMAAALLTTGVIATPIIRRFGRLMSISLSMILMAVGVLLVLIAPALWVSLLGAYLAGTGGAVAAVGANATLADEHPDVAPAVLTEANAMAGWVGLFAPLLMGLFLSAGLGWRWGLALAIPMCAGLAVAVGALRRSHPPASVQAPVAGHTDEMDVAVAAPLGGESMVLPLEDESAESFDATREVAPAQDRADHGRGVPPVFWIVMAAVSAAAGAEFGVNYWGATLLEENTGASIGAVTAVMSAPVVGIAVGRTLGARLALHLTAHAMLVGGWLLALVGFLTFWRTSVLPVAAIGLFVTGLGLSVIYPLLLDRSVLILPHRKDWALSIVYPFVGGAIGLAPYVLGALAGSVGVGTAFLVVPILMLIGLAAVLGSRSVATAPARSAG